MVMYRSSETYPVPTSTEHTVLLSKLTIATINFALDLRLTGFHGRSNIISSDMLTYSSNLPLVYIFPTAAQLLRIPCTASPAGHAH